MVLNYVYVPVVNVFKIQNLNVGASFRKWTFRWELYLTALTSLTHQPFLSLYFGTHTVTVMFTVTALLVKKVTRSVRKILGGGNVQAQKIISHVAAKMNRIEKENIILVFGYVVRLKVKASKGTRSPLYFTLRLEARPVKTHITFRWSHVWKKSTKKAQTNSGFSQHGHW